MKVRTVLIALLAVALGACGGQNRGSGSRMGQPAIPGTQGFQVPPLNPDSFNLISTLTARNPTIQTPFLSQSKDAMAAVTLKSGLVAFVGGSSTGTALTSTDIYDQRSAEFSSSGVMGQGRRHHTANLTSAGNIVVVGGVGQAQNPLVSAEVWNSATGSFSAVQQMREPRVGHTATALPSGEILVVGGFTDTNGQQVTDVVESLNLSTGQWRENTPLQATNTSNGIPRALHSAVTIPGPDGVPNNGDDLIVVIGGVVGDQSTKNITTITNSIVLFNASQTTTPPSKPPLPGSWKNIAISGQNSQPSRVGAKAHVVSTKAIDPVTMDEVSQIVVIGGLTGQIGTIFGPYTSTRPGESVVEDSPGVNVSGYVIDLENLSVTTNTPQASITQVFCIGDPANCAPFVGGIGAQTTYNRARGMILYTGGNTLCNPPPNRCLYNRAAHVVDLIADPTTGYITPISTGSSGSMGDLRSWHGSALLPGPDGILETADDTVIVAGGEQNPAGENQTADEYAFP